MNQQESNQLGQWTIPTTEREKAFFSRHSGAITRYTIAVIGIQLAWSFFSYNPAMALLTENTSMLPSLQPWLPIIAGAILGVLHYVLKAETLEVFSNWMDKDDTTINGLWNYIIPILICAGLFLLDKNGVSSTFRDNSFDGKKTALSAESQKALDKAKADYNMSVAATNSTKKDDEAAAAAPFSAQLAQARAIRTYDAQDVAAKNRKINHIARERDVALANVRKDASEAQKQALTLYNSEKARITGKLDSAHSFIDGQDRANAAKAGDAGWYVSAFFLILFLLMNYKLVYLRVNSGIRINKEFTQLDAEGSFFEKLHRVVASILQRQGQRFLVFFHQLGSTGTAELKTFDGRVILTQSDYNGSKITEPTPSVAALPDINNGDLNGDNGTTAPPPPPPLPPSNNNGDDDRKTPQPPAAPVPANTVTQPQTATASAVATSSLRWNDLNQDEKLDALNYMRAGGSKSPAAYWEMCEKLNPVVEKIFTNMDGKKVFCPLKFDEIYKAVEKSIPSVETPKTPVSEGKKAEKTVVTVSTETPELPKSVVTPQKTVTTVSNTQNSEFTYGDELLKSMKQNFGAELNNLKTGHGKVESVMTRLIAKSKEFDTAIRTVKATPKLRNQICEWVLDNVQPVITAHLNSNKEGTND